MHHSEKRPNAFLYQIGLTTNNGNDGTQGRFSCCG